MEITMAFLAVFWAWSINETINHVDLPQEPLEPWEGECYFLSDNTDGLMKGPCGKTTLPEPEERSNFGAGTSLPRKLK